MAMAHAQRLSYDGFDGGRAKATLPWRDWRLGDFGEKFRKAREKKGISLDDVAKVTKISVRNLQAIEDQNFEVLPGGVFNKGFIRAYAKHVGLNEEEAVTEYLACIRQEQIGAPPEESPTQSAPLVDRRQSSVDRRKAERRVASRHVPLPPGISQPEELPELHLPRAEDVRPPRPQYGQLRDGRIPWGLLAAALVVVVLGVVLWQRHERGAHAQEGTGVPTNQATAQPSAATPASTPLLVNPVPSAAGTTSKTSIAPAPQPANKNSTAVTPPDNIAQQAAPVPAAELANTVKAKPTMTLVIRATENSWVSVTADGQVVSQETLIAPAHTSVRASREIVAKVGNAAGVTFLWNGREIPSDGEESEVKTFVFDTSGMRVVPASPGAVGNR